eukprot:2476085-Prymnesium_polylepis.1
MSSALYCCCGCGTGAEALLPRLPRDRPKNEPLSTDAPQPIERLLGLLSNRAATASRRSCSSTAQAGASWVIGARGL